MAPAPGFSTPAPTTTSPSSSSAGAQTSVSEAQQPGQAASGYRTMDYVLSADSSASLGPSSTAGASAGADQRTPSTSDSGSAAGGIKTCTRCGRILEAASGGGMGGEAVDTSVHAAALPSRRTGNASVQMLPHHALLTDNSSLQPPPSVLTAASLSLEEDSHQVCHACLTSAMASSASVETSDDVYTQAQHAAEGQARGEAVERDADGDVVHGDGDSATSTAGIQSRQGLEQAPQTDERRELIGPSSDSIGAVNANAVPSTTTTNTTTINSNTATTTPSSGHPWRRAGPWSRILGQGSRSLSSEGSSTPLSISVANIGAGGDADITSTPDEGDFPPLSQSLSSPTATSPRVPLPSTIRGRGDHPTSPGGHASSGGPMLGRQSSFTRSQSNTGNGFVVESGRPSSPVVSFPSRGRARAGSSSSSTSGVANGSSNTALSPSRPRRPSNARRLSRSSSSQGPTAISFADLIDAGSGSDALSTTASIAENPFGPETMTRPRLGDLVTTDIQPAAPLLSTMLASRFEQPYLVEMGRRVEEEGDKKAEMDRLRWFDATRPDPKADISRLRCIGRGRGCLYPGATFNGIQKSGRNSYDVTVQIVNVDLAASHLCGYLNIRGLTDDWPELTTYFDAEIIGSKYGFVTGKWGATEAEDMKHWSRFTPFRPLRSSLTKPGLKFNHMNKPFIFMRWKERFLVPDHRVRDITGASFAGFYYVCVELGDQTIAAGGPDSSRRRGESLTRPLSPSSPPLSPPLPSSTNTGPVMMNAPLSTYGRARTATWRRTGSSAAGRTSVSRERQPTYNDDLSNSLVGMDVDEAVSATAGETLTWQQQQQQQQQQLDFGGLTSGRMSGFYFHEHSEPYQQLTLQHQPERSSSSFELR